MPIRLASPPAAAPSQSPACRALRSAPGQPDGNGGATAAAHSTPDGSPEFIADTAGGEGGASTGGGGGGGGGGLSFADWYQQITCQTGASVLWSGMHARVTAVDRDAEAYKLEVPALGRTVDVPFYSTELTAATLSAAHLRF